MAVSARRPPTIAMSAHEAFARPSGIGRYQTELIVRLAGRVDLNLLVHRPFKQVVAAPAAPPALSKVKVHYPGEPRTLVRNAPTMAARLAGAPYLLDWHRDTLLSNLSSRLFEGAYADRAGFDLYHGTASYLPITKRVRARVITIHDTTPLTMPERHVRQTVRGFVRPREIRETDFLIADSRSGLEELSRVVEHPPERTRVIHIGIDHALFQPEGPRPEGPAYLVSVGMIEPRKNLVRTLSAFERLAGSHPDLRWKVVGRRGWGWAEFEAALARSPARERVDLVGVLGDGELAALYRGAAALVYASLWEGFGIPVAEALACGAPVAASKLPAIEEVGGSAFVPLDPESIDSIAEAAERAAFDVAGREARRRAGFAQAATFDWARAADEHIEVYARALDRRVDELALGAALEGPAAGPAR